jgi:hypothetical protein
MSGLHVIPLSYKSTYAEMADILKQVNVVYIQGESDLFYTDQILQVAISYVLSYVFDKAGNNDFLPVFFMGAGLQYYLNNRLDGSVSCIKRTNNIQNKNLNLRVVAD